MNQSSREISQGCREIRCSAIVSSEQLQQEPALMLVPSTAPQMGPGAATFVVVMVVIISTVQNRPVMLNSVTGIARKAE